MRDPLHPPGRSAGMSRRAPSPAAARTAAAALVLAAALLCGPPCALAADAPGPPAPRAGESPAEPARAIPEVAPAPSPSSAGSPGQGSPTASNEPSSTSGPSGTPATPGPVAPYTETVTVTATRLSDHEDPARDVPASTTVLTRAQIAASGALTVQGLLSTLAGAIFFDQVGNGIQTTFDLRGFTGGGITVLVDGARINDPRNNAVMLETIGLDSIERIEVTRGAAAATVGGGSAAGVVNLVTRSGSGPAGGGLAGGYGSYGTANGTLRFSGSLAASGGEAPGSAPAPGAPSGAPSGAASAAGPGSGAAPPARDDRPGKPGFDWFVSVQRDTTDGFRENGDARLTRIGASAGYTFGRDARLSLALRSSDDQLGAPGALTLGEFQEGAAEAPFNQLDNSSQTFRQASLNWRGPIAGPFSLAANLSWLSRDSETLTTGRAAPLFGGFILQEQVRSLGGAVQSTADFRAGGVEHTLVFGAEAGRGTSDAGGCGTSPSDLSACDPASFLASENSTRRDDLAVFIQENAHLGGGVTLLAGARWDRSRYGYQESVPDPSNDSDRTFSETSWKGGIAWNGSGAIGLYANYGESFQPPTVEELFAFPGFGSNPDLEPVSARNYELGLRGALTGAAAASTPGFDYALSVFRTNLANEIIFTPRPTPQDPYAGTNENVGRSYREGVELTAGWRPARWVAVTAALSWTRARFVCSSADPPGSARCAASPDAPGGNEVPLVPDHRYAVAATFSATRDLDLRLELLQVGSQVLANDEANAVQRLDPYFVANARASWRASRRWELYAEVRNLLDEEYATRGIYAFDFSTFAGAVFVTPAPPRTFVAGAGFAF